MTEVKYMGPIPDHLTYNLDIIFVGFNPSLRSGEAGHHYANPRNRFWNLLYRAGLTPRLYRAEEDHSLLQLGYGMTNIVARPTKDASEITKQEYAEGRILLHEKISKFRPKIVCYVGKKVYEEFSRKKHIHWGIQSESVVPGVIDFVAPSSSGLVRIPQDEIIEIYKNLRRLLV